MKYCLIGLVGTMSLSISPLALDNLSQTKRNSFETTLDVGQAQNTELYAGGRRCYSWGCEIYMEM